MNCRCTLAHKFQSGIRHTNSGKAVDRIKGPSRAIRRWRCQIPYFGIRGTPNPYTTTLIKHITFIWNLSESFWIADSNQCQAESSEKYTVVCYGHIKNPTALGRGSDVVESLDWLSSLERELGSCWSTPKQQVRFDQRPKYGMPHNLVRTSAGFSLPEIWKNHKMSDAIDSWTRW